MAARVGRPGSQLTLRPAAVAVLLLSVVVQGLMWPQPASAAPQKQVTICHRTRAVSHPYTQITVDANSIIDDNGHGSHTGPVYPTPGWGDIIPPFDYSTAKAPTAHYPGLNWDTEGIAIWEAACDVEFSSNRRSRRSRPPRLRPRRVRARRSETASETDVAARDGVRARRPRRRPSRAPRTEPHRAAPPRSRRPPRAPARDRSVAAARVGVALPSRRLLRVGVCFGTLLPTSATSSGGFAKPLPPGATAPPASPPASELPPPLVSPRPGVEILPALMAVAIDPGHHVVNLGLLTVAQRMKLKAELDARGWIPRGAPPAGFGGAGVSDDAGAGWVMAGASFLALSCIASIAFWRRRSSS